MMVMIVVMMPIGLLEMLFRKLELLFGKLELLFGKLEMPFRKLELPFRKLEMPISQPKLMIRQAGVTKKREENLSLCTPAGARTLDTLIKSQVLYQLSYGCIVLRLFVPLSQLRVQRYSFYL